MHGYAIATPHRVATDAGVAIFRRGGNAIDAALAAASALTVVYPHMCSIGGDIMALVARSDGKMWAVNGSGGALLDCRPEDLRTRSPHMPLVGPEPITVPGAVSAWGSMATLAGTRPLSVAMLAAIDFAEEGVPVAPSVARALADMPELFSDPGMRSIFTRDGVPLTEGQTLRQPALAASLRTIAQDGVAALYGGEVGDRLVLGLRECGSRLKREDLARHVPEVTTPLAGPYRELEVLTAPPNSQGFVLLEILAALAQLNDVPDPLGDHAPLLAQLCRLASMDRDRYLADPRFADVPVEDLVSEAHGRELMERARDGLMVSGRSGRSAVPKGDTVAVVTADSEGNAASVIQSIFHTFGSGILEPQTGIILHNRGASFDLDPRSPNILAPGKRPLHTLMPVMVRQRDALVSVQGTMGGKAAPQIHLQLLLRMLRSQTPPDALAEPRWVVGGLEESQARDVLRVERSAGEPTLERLAGAGMEIELLADRDEEVGHGQLIRRHSDGRLEAGTDPRADGSAVVAPDRH